MYKNKHQIYQVNGVLKTIETFESPPPNRTPSNAITANPDTVAKLFRIYHTRSKTTSGFLVIDKDLGTQIEYIIYYDESDFSYFIIVDEIRYDLLVTADGSRILIYNEDGEEYINSNRLSYYNPTNSEITSLAQYNISSAKAEDLADNPEPQSYKTTKTRQEQIFQNIPKGAFLEIISPIFGTGENAIYYFYITFLSIVLVIILLLLI
jgi:hypothetical protein